MPHTPDDCNICYELALKEAVQAREIEASAVIAGRLKALCTIGWSSFYGGKYRMDGSGQKFDGERNGNNVKGWKGSGSTIIKVLRG